MNRTSFKITGCVGLAMFLGCVCHEQARAQSWVPSPSPYNASKPEAGESVAPIRLPVPPAKVSSSPSPYAPIQGQLKRLPLPPGRQALKIPSPYVPKMRLTPKRSVRTKMPKLKTIVYQRKAKPEKVIIPNPRKPLPPVVAASSPYNSNHGGPAVTVKKSAKLNWYKMPTGGFPRPIAVTPPARYLPPPKLANKPAVVKPAVTIVKKPLVTRARVSWVKADGKVGSRPQWTSVIRTTHVAMTDQGTDTGIQLAKYEKPRTSYAPNTQSAPLKSTEHKGGQPRILHFSNRKTQSSKSKFIFPELPPLPPMAKPAPVYKKQITSAKKAQQSPAALPSPRELALPRSQSPYLPQAKETVRDAHILPAPARHHPIAPEKSSVPDNHMRYHVQASRPDRPSLKSLSHRVARACGRSARLSKIHMLPDGRVQIHLSVRSLEVAPDVTERIRSIPEVRLYRLAPFRIRQVSK